MEEEAAAVVVPEIEAKSEPENVEPVPETSTQPEPKPKKKKIASGWCGPFSSFFYNSITGKVLPEFEYKDWQRFIDPNVDALYLYNKENDKAIWTNGGGLKSKSKKKRKTIRKKYKRK